jgi:two-component system response regulator AgrA
MIKIVVIEDDKNQQEKVKEVIDKTLFKRDDEVKVEFFNKYNKSLEKIIEDNTIRKIYIMDIELDSNISGIQIAKKIRENDWESEIIFTTSHDKMFETVYRSIYQVFDFIEKYHNMQERLEKDLDIIFQKNFDNKMLTYSNRVFDLKIYYRSILYIYREKDERKLVIVTETNTFKIGMTVQEMLELLDDRFKQCHRACIVNTERVHKYEWNDGYFQLDTKEEVDLLSKRFKKEVLGS